jgi:alkaline phosphatase D
VFGLPPLRSALPCLAARAAGPLPLPRAVEDGQVFFPQSVASGEPEARSVVLWTRALHPLHAARPLALTLQVALDARFEQRVLEAPGLRTSAAHDHTLKARVMNLEPNTRYHYRFLVEQDGRCLGSAVGRTRTGPASAHERPLHFVVARSEELFGPEAGRTALLEQGEEPDFILVLGDALPALDASVARCRDVCRAARAQAAARRLLADYPLLVLWEEALPTARRRATRRALGDYLPVEGLPGAEALPAHVGAA